MKKKKSIAKRLRETGNCLNFACTVVAVRSVCFNITLNTYYIYVLHIPLRSTAIISLKGVNRLVFVMDTMRIKIHFWISCTWNSSFMELIWLWHSYNVYSKNYTTIRYKNIQPYSKPATCFGLFGHLQEVIRQGKRKTQHWIIMLWMWNCVL